MHRVVVTGLGAVTAVGQTVDEFFAALVAARSGVRYVPAGHYSGPEPLVAALVDFDASAHWSAHRAAHFDRATQFGLVAAKQALAASSFDADDSGSIGVYWGTGLGGATSIEESYRQLYAGNGRVRPTSVVLGMSNSAAGNIAIEHGLRGSTLNVSTACSSSSSAIGEAYRAIKHGYADAIVAGGSEAMVTNGNLRAWSAMQALARVDAADASRSCKPFSAHRSGIVLGEGAAALMLERADRARARGAQIIAELVGYGNATDATHISRPDADGQMRAMRAALADAAIDPSEIAYLNAHGTATSVGDPVETCAIKAVFGRHASSLAVSSTKALHGHLIGAAGAVEMVAAIAAMERNVVPPTAHLDAADPACDLDFVPNEPRRKTINAVMSNSFGFGGMNAVLIARRYVH